jgi:hypothetical protein
MSTIQDRLREHAIHLAKAHCVAEAQDLRVAADALDTLAEIRDRLSGHPAYQAMTEEEEMDIGGDTAELSYLVRIADEALNKP